ncbi:MAG: 30S ribosome-binding factor RbfA [Desulfuromonadales bacterium]|nr:30S ribosome-binding factor RbfA [Desulfuromonadales bacterium]
MSKFRPERVAEQLHKEISQLLMHGVKDPRVALVTVTGVDITRDLRMARIYYTVSGGEEERRGAQVGLRSSAAYIRRQLGQIMRLRYVPELRFELDQAIESGRRIDELLRQVKDDLVDDDSGDSSAD